MRFPSVTAGRIALVALWAAAIIGAGSLWMSGRFGAQVVNGFNFRVMNPIRWVGAGGGVMTGNITFATYDGATPTSAAMSVRLLCTMPDDAIAVVSPASTRSGRQFTTTQTWDLPAGWTGPIRVPYTLSGVGISLLTGYNTYCQVVAAGSQSGTSSSGAASSSPSAGPVAHYTFDDGTATDTSGNSNDGTLLGVTPQNGCMDFPGTGHISIPHDASISLPTTLSIGLWLNQRTIHNGYFVAKNPGATLNNNYGVGMRGPEAGWDLGHTGYVDFDNRAAASPSNVPFSQDWSATQLPQNTWTHIAVTVDTVAQELKFYFNGQLNATRPWTGGLPTNTGELLLGYGVPDFVNSIKYDGQMDDVRIYNRILTAQEVAQIAQVQPTCASSGPRCAEAVLGTYDWHGTLNENPSQDWHHSMTITSYNPVTGAFSGNGYWIGGPNQTWNVQGTITGATMTGHGIYTNIIAGYSFDFTGTIAANGTITGTQVDSVQRPGIFVLTKTQQVNCPAASSSAGAGSSSLHGGPGSAQCNDGLDNDNDRRIDMADPGCRFPGDDDETDLPRNPTICVASSSSSRAGTGSSSSRSASSIGGGSSSGGGGSSSSFRGGPGCGDGIVQSPEQCDDGNGNNNDACTNTCFYRCSQGGLCPDGQSCPVNGICPSSCGNSQVDSGEECDLGSGNGQQGSGCTAVCRLGGCVPGTLCPNGAVCPVDGICSPACGNGILDGAEECDIGSGNGEPGSGCSAQCTFGGCTPGELCPNGAECQLNGTCPDLCPDGIIDPGEQCDDGNLNTGDSCNNSCLLSCDSGDVCPGGQVCPQNGVCPGTCGNGTVDTREQCDDGNASNDDACTVSCQRTCVPGRMCPNGLVCPESGVCPNTLCGDGEREGIEQCDDGNAIDTDACTNLCLIGNGGPCGNAAQCQSELCVGGVCTACDTTADCPVGLLCLERRCVENPVCGNGKHEFAESCDDGDKDDADACSNMCRKGNNLPCGENAECASLLCIDGLCAACTSDAQCSGNKCVNGRCGDGCGNGQVNAGEACDAGGQNSDVLPDHCRLDCRRPGCGDGVRDAGELCDDGNTDNRDGCTTQCQKVQVQSDVVSGEIPDAVPECTSNAQCPAGSRCLNGVCTGLPLAAQCTRGDQCASGICLNGFCAPNQTQQGSVTGNVSTPDGIRGDSGPAAIAVMGAGAAAGWAWVKRRRRGA